MKIRILQASVTIALVLCAGSLAFAMDEQRVGVPTPEAGAAAPAAGVQGAAPAAKTETGTEVRIPGLGKLVLVQRKARMGRNPATGESIKIPAKKVVKFRVAKAAKDAILGKK